MNRPNASRHAVEGMVKLGMRRSSKPRLNRPYMIRAAWYIVHAGGERPSRRRIQEALKLNYGGMLNSDDVADWLNNNQIVADDGNVSLREPGSLLRDILRPKQWHVVHVALPLPAVYALYERGQIVYVGSTQNLRQRLGSHDTLANIDGASVKARYSPPKSFEWLSREARLINRLQPKYNKTHKFTSAEGIT